MTRIAGTIAEWSARQATSLALAANYYSGQYREVVWLIGDGRSGTTWVSSLVNHGQRYREMFEPFHPKILQGACGFRENQYIRPAEPRDEFREIAADIFSGRLRHRRVDADSRPARYHGLLVKDVFANLFAAWAIRRFPELKVLLLVRNPFAVALSKLQKRKWFWTTEPLDLLNQRALYEDYLQPFEDVIRRVSGEDDYIQKQVLIWAILHYVPLLQLRRGDAHVVFYEDVCARPEEEMSAIARHIRPDDAERVSLPPDVIRKPSRVTAKNSALTRGASPVDAWKRELTRDQIDRGLAILAAFNLDRLYGADAMPSREQLSSVRQRSAAVVLR